MVRHGRRADLATVRLVDGFGKDGLGIRGFRGFRVEGLGRIAQSLLAFCDRRLFHFDMEAGAFGVHVTLMKG